MKTEDIQEMNKTRTGGTEASVDPSVIVPESLPNVLGQTQYIDDLPRPAGCLQAVVRLSDSAHARILAIHPEEALALDSSVRGILAKDIPATNPGGSPLRSWSPQRARAREGRPAFCA